MSDKANKLLDKIEANSKQGITCPFCGEDGFDKPGLKNHLTVFCKDHADVELVRGMF